MPNLETPLVHDREQWYSSRPDYIFRMTERSRKYLFHIVEELELRGMPTELALLPFIESAFNPQAMSSAKAAGMWQFIPSTGKSFDQFRTDDFDCRQYASAQIGGTTPAQAANDSGVKSAAIGTAVGAAAGAAIGGGSGAAVGAGAGLLVGAAAGASAGERSAYGLQRRYDFGYEQCMYAKGHKIPVSGRFVSSSPSTTFVPPPPAPGAYIPPPPPSDYRPPPQ